MKALVVNHFKLSLSFFLFLSFLIIFILQNLFAKINCFGKILTHKLFLGRSISRKPLLCFFLNGMECLLHPCELLHSLARFLIPCLHSPWKTGFYRRTNRLCHPPWGGLFTTRLRSFLIKKMSIIKLHILKNYKIFFILSRPPPTPNIITFLSLTILDLAWSFWRLYLGLLDFDSWIVKLYTLLVLSSIFLTFFQYGEASISPPHLHGHPC